MSDDDVPVRRTFVAPVPHRVEGQTVEAVHFERQGRYPTVHVVGVDAKGHRRMTVLVATRDTWLMFGEELARRAREDDWAMPEPEGVA
jgi:hypothetical protein